MAHCGVAAHHAGRRGGPEPGCRVWRGGRYGALHDFVGHCNVFDREVFPCLIIDRHGQGASTFDVSRDYQFTWRGKVRFDGRPYSDSGRAPTPWEAA